MSQTDKESFIRWQGRTIEQLGFVNNLLIGLATALLIFGAKLPFDEKLKLSCSEKWLIIASLLSVFLSISSGVYVAWNRLRSFRFTTRVARQRETGKRTNISELRQLVSKFDKRTWPMLTIQTILFVLGALFFATFSILKYLT